MFARRHLSPETIGYLLVFNNMCIHRQSDDKLRAPVRYMRSEPGVFRWFFISHLLTENIYKPPLDKIDLR